MKISVKIFTGILLALTLASGHSCTTYRPVARQSGTASLQLFYDALSPYGEWVQNREYGFVWIPDVGRNFFPYATNGRWIYTDYGWTWLSDYEWGWAPFHYGRWDYDPAYGWFWFPGDEWGPAWVTWRAGDGYYGWSPMRPETDFGFSYPDDDIYSWIFVPDRDFGRRDLSRYFVSTRRNDEILPRTEVLRSRRADNSVYASGPDPMEVRRATGRNIDRVTVSELGTPGRRLNGNRLEIYRPRVVTATTGQRPAPSRITDVKDIRPMRERDRNYRPEGQGNIRELGQPGQPGTGQGTRESGSVENTDTREREARRQREQRQYDMQRQRQEAEEQQRQRQIENSGQKQEPDREYRQTRSERRQVTDQQKRVMEKERQSNDRAIQDSSSSRRTERMQSKNIRRRR